MTKIWKEEVTVEQLNARSKGTINEALGIVFTELGENSVSATMPVDHRTHQPYGLLHGGASVVLAESLGSLASMLTLESPDQRSLGIEINANHLKAVKSGLVHGRATPIKLGRTLHVWEIRITDPKGDLVCLSRLTVMVMGQAKKVLPT